MSYKLFKHNGKILKSNKGLLRYNEPPIALKFRALEVFSINVKNPGWDGTMEYSTDTVTWNTWDGSEISGTVLYLRGTGNTKATGASGAPYEWTLTGSNITCTGNIESLLDYQTVAAGNHPAMTTYCYNSMFYGCTSLTTAPELPATTLTNNCYQSMFRGCTNLTAAPELPATTLTNSCYNSMFYGCTSLTTAPELPATTLTNNCYNYMFYGCTSLKLSATQTADYAQEYRIPTSGTGTTTTNALFGMFNNTGGTFTETPTINTTYYLHKDCSIV